MSSDNQSIINCCWILSFQSTRQSLDILQCAFSFICPHRSYLLFLPCLRQSFCKFQASIALIKRLSSRAPRTISGWKCSDCFKETTGRWTIDRASHLSDNMTVEQCATFCGNTILPVFSMFSPSIWMQLCHVPPDVEYGRKCFCVNSLHENLPAPAEKRLQNSSVQERRVIVEVQAQTKTFQQLRRYGAHDAVHVYWA